MTISREEFGAKSANLAAITPVIAELDASNAVGPIEIPPFEAVSTNIYDRWRKHELSGADFSELFNRAKMLSAKGSGVMVRSSAVLGEDGETSMGAGVYTSVRLKPSFKPSDFYRAVSKVYRSTSSPEAIAYLEQLGIDPEDERMGILLQTFPTGLETNFTVDSKMAGNEDLVFVRTSDLRLDNDEYDNYGTLKRSKMGVAVLDRTKIEAIGQVPLLGHHSQYRDLYHVVPDLRRFRESAAPIALAKTALIIESAVGMGVQIEAVNSRNREHIQLKGWQKLWIVQHRPLVRDVGMERSFEGFPEGKELLYEGRGVGVINGTHAQIREEVGTYIFSPDALSSDLEALPENEMRLLVFSDTFAKGGTADRLSVPLLQLSPELRKKVAVLVRNSSEITGSGNSGGHFETMCLELGIPCIFYDPTSDEVDRMYDVAPGDTVQMYSDGYKARLYSIDDL